MLAQPVLMNLLAGAFAILISLSHLVYASEEGSFDAFEFPKNGPETPKYFDDYGHVNTHFGYEMPGDAFEQPSTPVLSNLFKSYSLTMRDLGITTWLAHGTLLSWYWGYKVFPWETDIDMHTTLPELKFLSSYYNMTVHQFRFHNTADGKIDEYLLDINPNFHERQVGRLDNNRIDARWVDMSNGAYIDITAIHPLDSRAQEKGKPMLWQTKDGHIYDNADIYPLQSTVFEGMEAWVPAESAKLSSKEYTEKALTQDVFRDYRFDEEERQWIAISPQATG